MGTKNFKIGDMVYWTDPDKGKLSRSGVISHIRKHEGLEIFRVIVITDEWKRVGIDCFAHELNHLV